MRRFTLTLSLLLLIPLTSCIREIHSDTTSETIEISAMTTEVKGLLNSADLSTNGTRIHIVDRLSGFSGQVNGSAWTNGEHYIDEDIIYGGNTVWNFASATQYPWTTSGEHTICGWLTHDAKANNLAGLSATDLFGANGLSFSDGTLSVAGTELNTNSPQYDMLYSDVQTRNMNASPRPTGLVNMNMSHLFSAISIVINNSSVDRVKVISVTTSGLANKKSASIPFSSAPTYTAQNASSGFAQNAFTHTDTWMETGAKYDLLSNEVINSGSNGKFYIIWPQTAAEMAAARITIKYYIDGDYVDNMPGLYKEHTANLVFPANYVMNAGMKYLFTLTFANKRVKLFMKVLPWDYNAYNWNYEDSTVSQCQDIQWLGDPGVDYIRNGKNISFKDGKPIEAWFKIKTPVGGQWSLELRGDTSDNIITVSPDSGTVNADVDDGKVYLTFTPNLSIARTDDITVSMQFWVTYLNGYTKDLNSEINYDNWTITLPK